MTYRRRPADRTNAKSEDVRHSETADGPPDPVAEIVSLSRTIGNHAVARLLSQRAHGADGSKLLRGNGPGSAPTQQKTETTKTSSDGNGSAAAQGTPSPEFPPSDVMLPRVASGNTKKYHYLPPYRWGWLETDEDTRNSELQAYDTLKDKVPGIKLPEVRKVGPSPLIEVHNGPAKCGFWIENIALKYPGPSGQTPMTIKPLMMAFDVNPHFRRICSTVKQELGRAGLERTKQDLEDLKKIMPQLTQIVGEVTLAVDRTSGKVVLLDVAPGGGQTAADQTKQILSGMENMIAHVATELKKLAAHV